MKLTTVSLSPILKVWVLVLLGGGPVFKPGEMVKVNGQYVGEFVRENAFRVAIVMDGVVHVFIKKEVVPA